MLQERMEIDGAALAEAILTWGIAHGAVNISALDGAWIGRVDPAWTIAVNGHNTPVAVKVEGHMAIDALAPFEIAVWYNGWIAGLLSPLGEGTFAAGEGANPETFLAALKGGVGHER